MSFKDEINFCIDFLRIQENPTEKSCIYSPVSILNALAMIYSGAEGSTAEQIAAVLGNDKDETEIINYYSEFIQRHKVSKDEKESDITGNASTKTNIDDDITFKIMAANQLFIDKKIRILDSFNETITEKFDGQLQQVNFKDEKDHAVKAINKFVNNSTKGMIDKICENEDVKDETEIILINAIYFIGKWATPFDNRRKKMFYSKIPREIGLMSKTMPAIYTKGEEWKCVGIPYKEWKVWMFILLPNEKDGLQKLINKMDYSMLMECTKGEITHVEVTIPVFEISAEYDLSKDFEKLGITDMFNPVSCNLSKMVDRKDGSENSYIDKAMHKAIIKVDEYGTEAAAVTREDRVRGCKPYYFKADHPFFYFIVSSDKPNEDPDQRKPPTELLFAGTFC